MGLTYHHTAAVATAMTGAGPDGQPKLRLCCGRHEDGESNEAGRRDGCGAGAGSGATVTCSCRNPGSTGKVDISSDL